jgi:hypothetical protein
MPTDTGDIADHTHVFFEKIVLDLMKAVGYGGWGDAAGRLTSAGADEGIDGIIHFRPPQPRRDLPPGQTLARPGRAPPKD